MKKVRRALIAVALVCVFAVSFPLSSLAYSGSFTGRNYVYGDFMTADGVRLDTFQIVVTSSGMIEDDLFTGNIITSIPAYVMVQGNRFDAKSVEFFNGFQGGFYDVRSEKVLSGPGELEATVVRNTSFDVNIAARYFPLYNPNYWSTWFTTLVCQSSYGSAFGTTPGNGGSWHEAFKVTVYTEATEQDVLGALADVRGDLGDIKDKLDEGNQTLNDILDQQKAGNDKLDGLINDGSLTGTADSLEAVDRDINDIVDPGSVNYDGIRDGLTASQGSFSFSSLVSPLSNAARYVSSSILDGASLDFSSSDYSANVNIFKLLGSLALVALFMKILGFVLGRDFSLSDDLKKRSAKAARDLPVGNKSHDIERGLIPYD